MAKFHRHDERNKNKDKDKKYLNKKEKIIFVAKGNKEEKYKKFESEEDLSLQEEYESF